MHRLLHLEWSVYTGAHLKSSSKRVTSCSVCDLDLAIKITSSMKAFLEELVF